MLKLLVNNNKQSDSYIEVNIPTDLKEITTDYLKSVTDNIDIADYHILIALCYREKLSTLSIAYKGKKKETQAAVVPLFIKAGNTDNEFINNISCGNTLVIGGSDIALGYHVNAPKNQLTLERIMNTLELDKNVYFNLINKQEYCYFVEFKIVPANVIHGAYNNNENNYKSPFIVDSSYIE